MNCTDIPIGILFIRMITLTFIQIINIVIIIIYYSCSININWCGGGYLSVVWWTWHTMNCMSKVNRQTSPRLVGQVI